MIRLLIIHILLAVACLMAGAETRVRVGAERIEAYGPSLAGKRLALLSNHTGVVDTAGTHSLDLMRGRGLDVRVLLSPEHGFRGTADAGEHVASSIDGPSGLPVVSLYGGGKADPLKSALLDSIDAVVIDLQDVGVRFYTYHITMIRVMEAAARVGRKVIVMDRPNPLGMTVDGPMLSADLRSGVGRLPIPVIHGLTMGEIALMANGEHWLADSLVCDLEVVECEGYTHATRYRLPVAPSPNLKSMEAIYLYPSTCLFEGTTVSLGRGTDHPFTIYGHPAMKARGFRFTPRSMPGAKYPPLLDRTCNGVDLRGLDPERVIAAGMDFSYVIDAYRAMPKPERTKFFSKFFNLLTGDRRVRQMIADEASNEAIRAIYRHDLEAYSTLRDKYLIYPKQ